MVARRLLVWAVIYSVAAASCTIPCSSLDLRGDLNGDNRTDIRDLQVLVAQIVAGSASAKKADLNRDGRVDVRDLQLILARLKSPVTSGQDIPSDKNIPRTVSPSQESRLQLESCIAKGLLPRDDQKARSFTNRADGQAVLTPQEERYLLTLTANAPPASC